MMFVSAALALAMLAPKKYLLRSEPKAGQSSHVQLDIHIEGVDKPGTWDTHVTLREEFLRKTAKGFEWRITIERANATMSGAYQGRIDPNAVKDMEGQSYVDTTDSLGRTLSGHANNFLIPYRVTFPERAVSIGENWTSPYRTEEGGHTMEYTLKDVVNQKQMKLAVIDAHATGFLPVKDAKPKRLWVNLENGDVMRSEMDATTVKPPLVRNHTVFVRTYDSPLSGAKHARA